MKPIIICIIGESGSGKSLIADHLNDNHSIPMVQSRATRAPRHEGETGHIFISEEEFDSYAIEDMLALTNFGGKRYCCLRQDITADVMCYVVDEIGVEYFFNHFQGEYEIHTIRIKRSYEARVKAVGQDRVDRDKGKFKFSDGFYDFVIDNQGDSKEDVLRQVNMIIKLITN